MVRSPPSRKRGRASRTTRERRRKGLRPLLLGILLVHLLQERRRRNIPLLLKLDQFAGAMPVFELLGHELAPRSIALGQRHRETPRLLQNGRQRHLEARPLGIGKTFGEGG